MRRDAPRPAAIPQLVRGAVAQQQVRAGVAQAVAEGADAGIEAALPPVFTDDAAAAAGGIDVGEVYRSGGRYQVREV